MENSNARRQQITSCTKSQPPPQSSPRLVRSRSGTNTISTTALNTSQRFNNNNNNRSKSTTKTRPNYKDEDNKANINPNPLQSINSNVQKKPAQESREGFARFLHRGIASSPTPRGGVGATKTSLLAGSPSAWALSPGRSLASPVAVESPGVGRVKVKSSSGGVGGVLKYFRAQKKVSPIQEEEFHRFRVLHNKLLQWRFANARADAAMEATKIVAEAST
ncbi:hypothetical protein FEM48_Zijuj03G0135900 [Ziziphus jujuba var. spinosa]|uniref:Uncharacterized protein n=1 Tax=Ziziphus jujuba var. spinosa TaxID=714518 RepID=A0A978VQL6_ZIZJJ|nr:hypothetical protein FEM48_Zijuj03G0135900 [Ziziphus jujuba var. spinosa]